ncbi:MAG TPA: GNAT family N-acetyltransferase [Planctomycetaceae bacterium]|nr:GNAT family N-acetyltransferase [Planctomycetaceae bacterium]
MSAASAEVFRWMIRHDLTDVLAIERTSFVEPWTEADLVAVLLQRDAMGLVLERHHRTIGYLIYELQSRAVRILRLAVHPLHRRMGVGRSLMEKLVNRPLPRNSHCYWASVPETNLPMQLFLRSVGFRALPPCRGACTYRFVLELE